MTIWVWLFLASLIGLLAFSIYRFYKERSYKVMLIFTLLGLVFGYYFKGLTDTKLASGGGIGVEGLFVAVTVMIIFLLDGIIAEFLNIALKRPLSKNRKIILSIGGIFIIISSFTLLSRLFFN